MTLTTILLDLLKIDSVTGFEKEICDFLKQTLKPLTRFECFQEHYSLVFQTKLDPHKKTIALYGHTDTVHNQQDTLKQFHCIENKIYGCGASDMKSGLAVMIQLMQICQKQKELPYNLMFVFYEREEGPYQENGLMPLFKRFPHLSNCDLAFALEPTNNAIQVGCVGGLHARVTFKGKSAHSARPWQGKNAIYLAIPLLEKLAKLPRKEVQFEKLTFYEVLHATLATAGKSRNSIPEECTLNLNYRFAPGKSIETAKEELFEFIGDACTVEIIDACPSGKVVTNNPILEKFQKMHRLPYEAKQAWTDIAQLGLYEVPAVNFGPGEPAQAHQKNEWIYQEALENSFQYFHDFFFHPTLK